MGCSASTERGAGGRKNPPTHRLLSPHPENIKPSRQDPARPSGSSGDTRSATSSDALAGSGEVDLEPEEGFSAVYKLKGALGSGKFSVVKLGVHKQTGQEVAVKCLRRGTMTQADEAALKHEVRLLTRLRHPHIVEMLGFYRDAKFYYIVMEVVRGGELFDRIVKKQSYSEKEARDVLRVLLGAIKYCHDQNVVHRDLKPENLLLVSKDDDTSIKVADFGFAKFGGPEGLLTQCGTPGYVAPEVIRGSAYGTEVDMWSIGVIMFLLLGGYPPFHAENRAMVLRKVKKGEVTFHPKYWSSISPEAIALVKRFMTMDPRQRITAAQALNDPWMRMDDRFLSLHSIDLSRLASFNARRKLRSAISAVIVTNRLAKAGGTPPPRSPIAGSALPPRPPRPPAARPGGSAQRSLR